MTAEGGPWWADGEAVARPYVPVVMEEGPADELTGRRIELVAGWQAAEAARLAAASRTVQLRPRPRARHAGRRFGSGVVRWAGRRLVAVGTRMARCGGEPR